jgi:hypothetical protein
MANLVEIMAGRVARLRKERDLAKKRRDELTVLLQDNPLYQELVATNLHLSNVSVSLQAAEHDLREEAVKHSERTGYIDAPMYKVKNYTIVTYDHKTAVEWCIEHFRDALTLDTSRFEKVIKVMKPDIATITTEKRASLPSDLSSFEGVEDEIAKSEEVPF